MDFVSNQKEQLSEMLKVLEVDGIGELFCDIPALLKRPPINADDGLSEFEGFRLMEALGKKNTFSHYSNYLGAGVYEHHVPAIVSYICSKGGFLTAYTPYQAEASQGILQAIFEYQSAICALTGMDVSNASVYDGASSCAEAVLMALRHFKNKRKKVFVASSLNPHYFGLLKLYLASQNVEIHRIPFRDTGEIDYDWCKRNIDGSLAVLLAQTPNFFGIIEDLAPITELVRRYEGLTVVCANPLAYGLYASAAQLGGDIAVGDTQPFGIPLQFGGPNAGYMACRKDLVRQLPARIVGKTLDLEGKPGYVLTLQAREQHIRREKATSNICTSQTLSALASLISILWYGKQGIEELALTNYQRASYLKEHLEKIPGISPFGQAPIFNEFVVKFHQPLDGVLQAFRDNHIEPGVSLERYFPELKNHLLIAVTETKSKEELDRYLSLICEITS